MKKIIIILSIGWWASIHTFWPVLSNWFGRDTNSLNSSNYNNKPQEPEEDNSFHQKRGQEESWQMGKIREKMSFIKEHLTKYANMSDKEVPSAYQRRKKTKDEQFFTALYDRYNNQLEALSENSTSEQERGLFEQVNQLYKKIAGNYIVAQEMDHFSGKTVSFLMPSSDQHQEEFPYFHSVEHKIIEESKDANDLRKKLVRKGWDILQPYMSFSSQSKSPDENLDDAESDLLACLDQNRTQPYNAIKNNGEFLQLFNDFCRATSDTATKLKWKQTIAKARNRFIEQEEFNRKNADVFKKNEEFEKNRLEIDKENRSLKKALFEHKEKIKPIHKQLFEAVSEKNNNLYQKAFYKPNPLDVALGRNIGKLSEEDEKEKKKATTMLQTIDGLNNITTHNPSLSDAIRYKSTDIRNGIVHVSGYGGQDIPQMKAVEESRKSILSNPFKYTTNPFVKKESIRNKVKDEAKVKDTTQFTSIPKDVFVKPVGRVGQTSNYRYSNVTNPFSINRSTTLSTIPEESTEMDDVD